jgi:hypothetical protein
VFFETNCEATACVAASENFEPSVASRIFMASPV